jgi:photosystem II stability/assembly factor-like uncharacterized protein
MKKRNWTSILFLLGVSLLAACQSATGKPTATLEPTISATATPEPTATMTKNPQPWQTLTEFSPLPLETLVGFHDPKFGIYIGDDSRVFFSEDGGANWQPSKISSLALYGMDIVDRDTAWVCGNRSIRVTLDGARTWQNAADFGDAIPNNCRFLSFLDSKTGWAATSAKLASTTDGASTWTELALPKDAGKIAAISLYAAGKGYFLDNSGNLFSTEDNGQTWNPAVPLPLGELTIASLNPPVAAMRFQNANRGVVIISAVVSGTGQVAAFQTYDGGKTWKRQPVTDSFCFPVLSHDGGILTLYSLPTNVLVLQYAGN